MVSQSITGTSILHIITRLDKGGSADVALDLVSLLARDGARVGLVYGKTKNHPEKLTILEESKTVTMFNVPQLVREISPVKDTVALVKVRDIIRSFRPDIVHTHTSKAGIIGRVAGWSCGVNNLVHTPHGHIFYGYYNSFVTWCFVVLEQLAARITKRITTLTHQGLLDHVQRGIGTESLFRVVHCGIDIERFTHADGRSIRNELGWQDRTIVGWVGRLVPVKDCGTFLEASALVHKRFPEIRFLVVGNGEEYDILVRKAQTLGLGDSILFLGQREDIPLVMKAIDIFVLTSLNEGFGRVLIEAMSAGAVVISSRVGGTPDIVEDGVSGLLIPPADPQRCAEAIHRVLEDGKFGKRLIQGGRKQAMLFDTRTMVDEFERVYAELLDSDCL